MTNIKHIKKQDFCEFYWKLKELKGLAQKYKFGNGFKLPSPFTEKLCRYLYGLSKKKGSPFDAIDDLKNNIEIKATVSKYGTTSMSIEKFDFLYWMYFDLNSDLVSIYRISWDDFIGKEPYEKNFNLNKEEGKKRINVRLNQYMGENELIDIYKFNQKESN
ncbi:hypothetical protein [Metabacillus niabensis]|uniref:hypothetical protein n=1 Tax=Metabacillus niabensis TaxID=324854 RepID=UPI0039A18825